MNMRARFLQEVAAAGLPAGPGPMEVITPDHIAHLPEPARRYLHFMGVVGRPRDWSFRLGYTGRFRTKPDHGWMGCQAWQYSSQLALARIFHIRIRMGGLLPVLARDTYVAGRGRMLVRLLDRFTLADGTGDEFDTGELVTYLNDAVLLAPSLLLTPAVEWLPEDDGDCFALALTDRGRTVRARVVIDPQGAPTDFTTHDRFCFNPSRPSELLRTPWSTPVAGWQVVEGRPQPTRAQAVWQLPGGPFAYADFGLLPGSLVFNLPPGM